MYFSNILIFFLLRFKLIKLILIVNLINLFHVFQVTLEILTYNITSICLTFNYQ